MTNHIVGEKVVRILEMMRLLSRREMCTEELAEEMAVSRRTVQRYLQHLRYARVDLVEREDYMPTHDGPHRFYRLRSL